MDTLTTEKINKLYRKMMLKYHPDKVSKKNSNYEELTKKTNEIVSKLTTAKETLQKAVEMNPLTRFFYHSLGFL